MNYLSLLRHALFSPVVAAFVALTSLSSPLHAQAAFGGGNMVAMEVLPGWRTRDGSHIAAIKLTLAPDWVTYWRVPGEAGIPPRFSLSQSKNISGAFFSWPRPIPETKNDMQSFVYYDQVIVPITVTLKNPREAARLAGKLEIGVCADVCIPVRLSFDAVLPADVRPPTQAIQTALSLSARAANSTATCDFTPSATAMGLRITAKLPPLKGQETVVVEHRDPTLWVSPARVHRRGNTLEITTSIATDTGVPSGLQRGDLRITVLSEGDMVEFNGCRSSS